MNEFQEQAAIIRIDDLSLRTIIGFNEWERKKKQEVLINVSMEFDHCRAAQTDDVADTLDYKTIKKSIITLVEESSYNLIEKLAHEILVVIMLDERVRKAAVRVDKPHALRFARSVSVEVRGSRE
ncbi:MAG: dihydroneopterin aldolase [Chitinivibrionales bacterium]|nr:dihydroneopterin aldolase [Chitinivibrionales bacterium]